VKATAVRGFYEAMKAREAWALSMAMRNLYGWDKPGSTGLNFNLPGKDGKPETMRIEFVSPTHHKLPDDEPRDVTPPSSQPIDYNCPKNSSWGRPGSKPENA
jgi:hypothetical protein